MQGEQLTQAMTSGRGVGGNVLTNFNNGAGDTRDQANYDAGNLYGNTFTQLGLTVIVRTDQRAFYARMTNANLDGLRYPGGADPFCLSVKEFDPIIGPKKAGTGGKDFMWGFSSINGLPFSGCTSVGELEDNYHFIGVSRSHHDTVADFGRKRQVEKHGFAVITHGITTVRGRWKKDIFPGDRLIWSFPSLRDAIAQVRTKTTSQVPTQKLTIEISALDWSFLHHQLRNVTQLFLRSANDIGISHRLGGGGGNNSSNSGNGGGVAHIRTARAIKDHTLFVIAKGVEILSTRGLVTTETPYKKKTRAAKDKLLRSCLEFIKQLAPGSITALGGGFNAAVVNDFQAMTAAGTTKLTSDASSALIRAPRSGTERAGGAFLKAYLEYSEAVTTPKTDVVAMKNVTFGDEFNKPYSWHSTNRGLEKLYGNGTLVMNDPNSASEAKVIDVTAKMDRVDDALYVAHYLGLVDGGKGEKKEVVYDLLNATHAAYTGQEVSVKYMTGSALGPKFDLTTEQHKLTLLEQYSFLSEDHLSNVMEESAKLQQNIQDKCMGRAMSHAVAGKLDTTLDIAVNA